MKDINIWFNKNGYEIDGSDPWVRKLEKEPIKNLFKYIKDDDILNDDTALTYLIEFANTFIKMASKTNDLKVSYETTIVLNKKTKRDLLNSKPFCFSSDYITEDWIELMWFKMGQWIKKSLKAYKGSLESFFASFDKNLKLADRIYFHLVESEKEDNPFAFRVSYTTKINNTIKHVPLDYALTEFKGDNKALLNLLTTIMKAGNKCKLISDITTSGEIFKAILLSTQEAYELLNYSDEFEELGIGLRFPTWWLKHKKHYGNLTISSIKEESAVGATALLNYDLKFNINGQDLTKEEILELLEFEEGLTLFNGEWIAINHKQLKLLLDKYNEFIKENGETITFRRWLEIEKGNSIIEEADQDVPITIEHEDWLLDFINHDIKPKERLILGKSFHGELRDYQNTGTNWLKSLLNFGFGACLADDMGLGKTIQILSLLQDDLNRKRLKNALLIVPASLIGNWEAERNKFAPSIPFTVLRYSDYELSKMDLQKPGIYITTYQLACNRKYIKEENWQYIILDEAQAIKNPTTKQAKVIKTIPAEKKIAMTGTPIENRLMDIWSLFDFLNPGMLGSKKEFTQISKKLEQNAKGFSKFRNIIEPFILRRLKTDKSIINDLPEKIETEMPIGLTPKQIVLYKKVVKDMANKLESEVATPFEKAGLVIKTITKTKQVCNHPDQYLKFNEFKESSSSKFKLLRSIAENVNAQKERMVVFTQYKQMAEPIAKFLEKIFNKQGLIIDGSVSPIKRTKLVDEFNGKHYVPFMVITIKSGGTGLNLVAANHCVHFDRWWNPAVENQATDRIFRIGQKKVVNVYKFRCTGTVEDKISNLLEKKANLSDSVIGSNKSTSLSWVSELDTDAILDLFKLTSEGPSKE